MLYATTKVVALAVAVSEKEMINFHTWNRQSMDTLSARILGAKEFLRENRVEFGVDRVRDDLVLWSIPDIMYATSRIRTPEAHAFRVEFSRLVVENVRRAHISSEQYTTLMKELEELRASVTSSQTSLQTAASAAGVALAAQKGTRKLRLVR